MASNLFRSRRILHRSKAETAQFIVQGFDVRMCATDVEDTETDGFESLQVLTHEPFIQDLDAAGLKVDLTVQVGRMGLLMLCTYVNWFFGLLCSTSS